MQYFIAIILVIILIVVFPKGCGGAGPGSGGKRNQPITTPMNTIILSNSTIYAEGKECSLEQAKHYIESKKSLSVQIICSPSGLSKDRHRLMMFKKEVDENRN